MTSEDQSYYRKRAQEERERAAACEDSSVAMAHLKMADEYERRLLAKPTEYGPDGRVKTASHTARQLPA